MIRYNPNIKKGLSCEQVKMRMADNLVNHDTSVPTKSIPKIIADNVFTLFNILNLSLALAIFLVGSYKNLLFLGVVICNTIISMIQEIRSKLVIDKLSVIAKSKVKVIRDGQVEMIDIEQIVLDDIMILRSGDQVIVDAFILDEEVEVDESFITGESETVVLGKGSMLKSGSFIVVGSCKARVEHIGEDNYTSLISKSAKYVKEVNSILMKSLNKIIKIISIAIIPMGLLLFFNQYNLDGITIEQAVVSTVAGLISMIPEGLVLLTSTVLAVSVIRLAKLKVLVQELYCIEMLAHVDTICLDKTGTITDGKMAVKSLIPLKTGLDYNLILGNMINHLPSDNATMEALKAEYKALDDYQATKVIPFSPVYKYSGVSFKKEGSYVLGAPEFIYNKEIKEVNEYATQYRVILLCHSKKEFDQKSLPSELEPIALITLEDTIRPSIKGTFEYFKKQKVDLKIISGDNVLTVASIAKRAGLDNIKAIDVSKLSDEQLKDAVLNNNVFGRVKPAQKKQMIEYLKSDNHIVAMTGDGVNDVLALKTADCSIALASGSDASRNVSQLVLLDSDFNVLAQVVKEGRRSINNIERSASLFLTKTTYALLLALLFVFMNQTYPFEPIQLTLTSVFTIGIPSFILALEPNDERIKGNFLINVLKYSLPSALTIVLNIVIISIIGHMLSVGQSQISTVSVIMTGYTGFMLLFKICLPFNRLRISLFLLLICGFIYGVVGLGDFFQLTLLSPYMCILMAALICLSTLIFNTMSLIVNKFIKNHPKLFVEGKL